MYLKKRRAGCKATHNDSDLYFVLVLELHQTFKHDELGMTKLKMGNLISVMRITVETLWNLIWLGGEIFSRLILLVFVL